MVLGVHSNERKIPNLGNIPPVLTITSTTAILYRRISMPHFPQPVRIQPTMSIKERAQAMFDDQYARRGLYPYAREFIKSTTDRFLTTDEDALLLTAMDFRNVVNMLSQSLCHQASDFAECYREVVPHMLIGTRDNFNKEVERQLRLRGEDVSKMLIRDDIGSDLVGQDVDYPIILSILIDELSGEEYAYTSRLLGYPRESGNIVDDWMDGATITLGMEKIRKENRIVISSIMALLGSSGSLVGVMAIPSHTLVSAASTPSIALAASTGVLLGITLCTIGYGSMLISTRVDEEIRVNANILMQE